MWRANLDGSAQKIDLHNIRILPCPGIEFEGVAAAALAHMVAYAAEWNYEKPFFGIISSLKTVILVEIAGATVRTTGPLPFAIESLPSVDKRLPNGERIESVASEARTVEKSTATAFFASAAFQERPELER
jgi:hypothetical protein